MLFRSSNHDLVDLTWIANKYGIPGERYGLFAMIRGDASDGLPGIKGIGEKGAAAIAQEFSSMEAVIDAAQREDSRLHPTHRKKILADLEYAAIAHRLVSCAVDIRLPKQNLAIPREPKNREYLQQLKTDYGLGSSVDRLFSALNWC